MPPQPPEPPASIPRPRRAASPLPRTLGARVFPAGAVPDSSADVTGRHRRPESLADHVRLRAEPSAAGSDETRDGDRRPAGDLRPGFDWRRDGDLAPSLDPQRDADPGPRFDWRRDSDLRPGFDWLRGWGEAENASGGTWDATTTRRRSGAARSRSGKHAKPAEPLGFTAPAVRDVLPAVRDALPAVRDLLPAVRDALPAVRDVLPAVRDALPAIRDALPVARGVWSEGRRAVGTFRDWVLYTDDQRPVTGSHRAPGTLPIESWLLIGRQRQQALLATLVAVGLTLIMIPVQQGNDVNPVNAAEHGLASAGSSRKAGNQAPDAASKPPRHATKPGRPAPGQPAPAATTPGPPTAARPGASTEPTVAVPHGTGPAQSLRRTGSDAVALTFDDGPDPVETPKVLALLAKYHVKATFCLVGQNVEKHPEIVQQIVEAGHTLCNHTWNHSFTIGEKSPDAIRADLAKTDAAIRAAVPDAKIPFFRAPGGYFTDRLVSVAYEEGMASLYWEVDPRDWDHSTDADDTAHTDRVIAEVQQNVRPGSIILSHDYHQPDTIAAYEDLLPWLTQNFEIGMPVPPPPAAPASSPTSPPSSAPAESPASESSVEPR
jgi:peptidoglycan-N-acetylglucosamine deacetylase